MTGGDRRARQAGCPAGSCPEEDQGYLYAGIQLPNAASLQRTDAAARELEKIIMETPGVEYCTTRRRLQPAQPA